MTPMDRREKKRVLITGASGLLGACLALHLKNAKNTPGADAETYEVHAVHHAHPVQLEGCVNHSADLTRPDEAHKIMREVSPDIVVHCAAWTSVDGCEQNPALARLLNVDMTAHLLAACPPGAHIMYISTDAVFDGSKEFFTESDTPRPVNVYGKTKLESEELVARWHPHTIIRTNIYGWNIQDKCSFPEWVIARLRSGQKTPVFRDFTYTPILVNTLSVCLQKIIEKKQYGIVHVGSRDACTKEEFARRIARAFGLDENLLVPASVRKVALAAARPNNLALASEKKDIVKKLGVEETIEEGIARFKQLHDDGWPARLKAMKG